MSIWVSGEHVGTESSDEYEIAPGVTTIDLGDGKAIEHARAEGWRKVEHECQGGQVRAYRDGFSNHYPDETDAVATIDIASIPPWCVPGHDETSGDYPVCGDWARLSIDSPGALTWWNKDGGEPRPAPAHASVVIDVAAARALAQQLLAWADRPHLSACLSEPLSQPPREFHVDWPGVMERPRDPM